MHIGSFFFLVEKITRIISYLLSLNKVSQSVKLYFKPMKFIPDLDAEFLSTFDSDCAQMYSCN